jgi:hypothetical protein
LASSYGLLSFIGGDRSSKSCIACLWRLKSRFNCRLIAVFDMLRARVKGQEFQREFSATANLREANGGGRPAIRDLFFLEEGRGLCHNGQ